MTEVTRPYPAPAGRTARRVEWSFLPPDVRRLVEARLGSPVAHAHSQGGGFTPGMASVLVCEDGSEHFVKAASGPAQPLFAEAYRTEARRLAALPLSAAAPRLRWSAEMSGWFVLEIEHVSARTVARPWTSADLDDALALLAQTAEVLTPAPAAMALDDLATDLADWPGTWEEVRATAAEPDDPRIAAAAELASRLGVACAGDTVVHTDVRDDNLLVADDGRMLLCDWNWPVRGAAWLDSLWLLVAPRGDGLDVDTIIATHPTFTAVDPESLDVALAALAGYLLHTAGQRVPPTSPWIREHQRWYGEEAWDWLCQRRGWGRDR